MRNKLLLALVGSLLVLGAGYYSFQKKELEPSPEPVPLAETAPEVAAPEVTPEPTIYFPLTNYAARGTKRVYGNYIAVDTPNDFACGDSFSGYHNGDDLEVTPAELNAEVPVYAIADGTVLQANTVNGYGGIIIIEHKLAGQTVTANYGHINLAKASVSKGTVVVAGQKISVLGDNCSSQTSNERKHLHFALHKSSSIAVAGYIAEKAELENWHNPEEYLTSLKAAEPK